jgi:hypothetical protein
VHRGARAAWPGRGRCRGPQERPRRQQGTWGTSESMTGTVTTTPSPRNTVTEKEATHANGMQWVHFKAVSRQIYPTTQPSEWRGGLLQRKSEDSSPSTPSYCIEHISACFLTKRKGYTHAVESDANVQRCRPQGGARGWCRGHTGRHSCGCSNRDRDPVSQVRGEGDGG